jgi:hypothetical protein
MEYTSVELAMARDVSKALLEGLGLDAYLFEVEPKEDYWELKIECANEIDGSWTTTSVQIADELLMGASKESGKEEQLLEFLGKELSACKRVML